MNLTLASIFKAVLQISLLALTAGTAIAQDVVTLKVHHFLPPNDECVSFGQVAVGLTRWGRMANIKARGTPSPILPS